MKGFRVELNKVFQLQSKLRLGIEQLKSVGIQDAALGIQFDCQPEAKQLRQDAEAALEPLNFQIKGSFNQEVKDTIEQSINTRIELLEKYIKEYQKADSDFREKEKEYESYLGYVQFREQSLAAFNQFKRQVAGKLQGNLEQSAPQIFQEAQKQLSVIQIEGILPFFDFDFTKRASQERQALIQQITDSEKKINQVRIRANNNAYTAYMNAQDIAPPAYVEEPHPTTELVNPDPAINILQEAIEKLIRSTPEGKLQQAFREELSQLNQSASLKSGFHYSELHNRILKTQEHLQRKGILEFQLKALIKFKLPVHENMRIEKQNLTNRCTQLIDSSYITANELSDILVRINQWKETNQQTWEEEKAEAAEHLLLKTQIICQLENMGYTVLDQLNVLDFEKENSLLLKKKNAKSFLNLKFKADGSLRYVFKSAVPASTMSTDQQKAALHEMHVTCTDFQTVLEELEALGLKMDKIQERPISIEEMVPLNAQEQKLAHSTEVDQIQPLNGILKKRFIN